MLQPSWRSSDEEVRDSFPRVIRCGASYRFILRDWVPKSWHSFKRFVGNSQILATFDAEFYKGESNGGYFGVEGYFPLIQEGLIFSPRFGLNNRTEGPSVGAGLTLPFATSAALRIDYAHGFHPDLPEDSRFFVTLQMGKDLGASFVNLATQWLSFESQITPLDEIWEYDSPAEHWNSLCGSSGIALVRGQQIIAEITIEMN